MKRILIFLCCLMILMTSALSVSANDHGDFNHSGVSDHQGDSQHGENLHEDREEHTHIYDHIHDTATCDTAGTVTKTCACGEYITETSNAKGHHVESVIDLGGGKHEGICSRCGQKISESHHYGEWKPDHSRDCALCHAVERGSHNMEETVLKQPTCREDGTKKKYCSVCTYSETVVLTKLTSHTYDSACDPDCNVCSRKREIEHDVATTWSKNADGHWHECRKCDEKIEFSKHSAGPEATEEKDQVCTICSYVIEAKKEHKHNYEKEWTSDKVGHWHRCSGKNCKVESEYAAHVYDNECDADCNTCDYERENSHNYDTDGWKTSNFEHWNICSVCGEESKHEKHVAGEVATEQAAQVCTVCHFELAAKLEHVHDFGTDYLVDGDHHWQECSCGARSVPEAHVWDNGKKSRNNTVTYSCLLCEEEKTETSSAGFPWLTILLIILALICIGGIVVLSVMLKRGNYEDDSNDGEVPEEILHADPDEEDDSEERMIDDYFASLDEKQH